MKLLMTFALNLAALLGVWTSPAVIAQNSPPGSSNSQGPGFTSDVQDPVVEMHVARERREQAKTPGISLFRTSPLTPLRERGIALEKRFYQSTDIKFATNFNHLLQGLTDEIPGQDDFHDVCGNLGRMAQGMPRPG